MKLNQKVISLLIILVLSIFVFWSNESPELTRSTLDINETTVSEQKIIGSIQTQSIAKKSHTSPPQNQPSQKTYIVSCDSDSDSKRDADADFEQMLTEYEEYIEDSKIYLDFLEHHDDIDSQLVYSIFLNHTDPIKQIETLTNIIAVDPDNKLAHWNLLSFCARYIQDAISGCNKQSIKNALDINSQNAFAWFSAAEFASAKGNRSMMIDALQNLATAPNFDEYYSEHLSLLYRVLLKNETFKLNEKIVSTFSFTAADTLPSTNALFEFCGDEAKQETYIANYCLEAGKRMSHSAKTMITGLFGDAFQKISYKNLNDNEGLKRLKEESSNRNPYNNPLWKKASLLLSVDPLLNKHWFQNLIDYGELKAGKMLINEAVELSADGNYKPCLRKDL